MIIFGDSRRHIWLVPSLDLIVTLASHDTVSSVLDHLIVHGQPQLPPLAQLVGVAHGLIVVRQTREKKKKHKKNKMMTYL